jgi:formate hydrogenlyase subunit 3/multisubunit Na+/H+ antiporter MnhD subunit
LEASLRVKVMSKSMAFFALAMAVGLPGTTGFIAEDLLAHGLLEFRPGLAAAFVIVAAINAVALYLALVNIMVDRGPVRGEAPLSAMMIIPAGLSLLVGLLPRPFVASAVDARHALVDSEMSGGLHVVERPDPGG